MQLFYFLRKNSPTFQNKLFFYFGLVGILNFCIIAVTIASMGGTDTNIQFKNFFFLSLCILAYIFTQKYCLDQTNQVVEEIISKIRLNLTDQIRKAELLAFEKTGLMRYHTLLTQETTNISNVSRMSTRIISSSVIIVIACLYIGYLSLSILFFIFAFLGYGIHIYYRTIKTYEEHAAIANQKEQHFFQLIKHFLIGFKELKVDNVKNSNLYSAYLKPQAKETEEAKKQAGQDLNQSIIVAQVFFYILLGMMVFAVPQIFSLEASTLLQITALVLFVTSGPLAEIVEGLPFIERAHVAITRLEEIEKELSEYRFSDMYAQEETYSPAPFHSLTMNQLCFQYHHRPGDESPFGIGPINFTVNRGEIIFIMGGNGAGKTTLLKVLTGLYPYNDGEIRCNNELIDFHKRKEYRANFGVIFQKSYLFDQLYGVSSFDRKRADAFLTELRLQGKTSLSATGEISNVNLSSGQKKRLALLLLEIDNRDICVFDEWAADQDPSFRRFFYEQYLQKLVQHGKTVIAITHDDHYYKVADRVYRMDYGALTEIEIE
jgi:putative pyoverdin transport system ATP-binding/permease protein